MNRLRLVPRALLVLVMAAALIRLATLALGFARHSLQVDFSAYYTAGEAVLAGLSPYLNQVDSQRPIWDGLCFTSFSRFLYPPPSLLPFLGLAHLSYVAAKLLWTAVLLVFATAALALGARVASVPLRSRAVLLVALGLAVSWPLLLSLERGQIDLVTLVLLLGAMWYGRAHARWNAPVAGILWTLAIVFKPHTLLALPYLLLRRQWTVAVSTVAGLALTLGLSTLAAPDMTHVYLATVGPRLARYGDDPPKVDLLPSETMRRLLSGLPPHMASKQGHLYRRFGLQFDSRESLVWVVAGETPARPGALSVILWAALSGTMLGCRRPRVDESERFAVEDLAWWQAGLCVVLLSAPLTWAMNAVWLLPAGFVIAARQAHWKARATGWLGSASQVAAVLGLALAAVPDQFASPWPACLRWISPYKYVLGTALVAVAMVAGSWAAPRTSDVS